jgi:hypothetical protein
MKNPLTIILTAGLMIYAECSISSAGNYPAGARQSGMANSSVTLFDLWSIYHNQAGLAYLKHISTGIHHENKFNIKEYALQAFAIALPVKSGVFGLSLSYFGYNKYNEIKTGLAFAKSFGDMIYAAVQIDYFNIFISNEYGNKGTALVEAGFIYKPADKLAIGAHIFNPAHKKISEFGELLPTIFRVGASYNFFDKVILCAENEKDIQNIPVYKIGMEYHINNSFFFRAGLFTNPSQITSGIGYVIKHIKADVAFSTHHELGITPYFSLSYEFNNR